MRTIRAGLGKEHRFPYNRDATCRGCGAAYRLEVGDAFDRRDGANLGPLVSFPCPNCAQEVTLYENGPAGFAALTPREREIARVMLEGHASKEIAGLLCRSPNTVKNHITGIYRKLGVRSRAEFILAALAPEAAATEAG